MSALQYDKKQAVSLRRRMRFFFCFSLKNLFAKRNFTFTQCKLEDLVITTVPFLKRQIIAFRVSRSFSVHFRIYIHASSDHITYQFSSHIILIPCSLVTAIRNFKINFPYTLVILYFNSKSLSVQHKNFSFNVETREEERVVDFRGFL